MSRGNNEAREAPVETCESIPGCLAGRIGLVRGSSDLWKRVSRTTRLGTSSSEADARSTCELIQAHAGISLHWEGVIGLVNRK